MPRGSWPCQLLVNGWQAEWGCAAGASVWRSWTGGVAWARSRRGPLNGPGDAWPAARSYPIEASNSMRHLQHLNWVENGDDLLGFLDHLHMPKRQTPARREGPGFVGSACILAPRNWPRARGPACNQQANGRSLGVIFEPIAQLRIAWVSTRSALRPSTFSNCSRPRQGGFCSRQRAYTMGKSHAEQILVSG
jgi:hypothetical protein